ncbi:MAG: hypothetical protein IPN34_16375 [Planctomycetes bacterium]|nr:hypothetical protein [Planctomycetota bacterium]
MRRSSCVFLARLLACTSLLVLGARAFAQDPAPPAPLSEPVLLRHAATVETPKRFYVQRIATRERRPKDGVHAPSEMTLDWLAERSAAAEKELLDERVRLRGLKTGARNRLGDWVEIDSRSEEFARSERQPKLREQVQRMLASEVRALFTARGELCELAGAEKLFEAGEKQEQRVEELRSMLRLALPIFGSERVSIGSQWSYDLPYSIGNWLGGHRLKLRCHAEVKSREGDVLGVEERWELLGEGGRVASGYTYRAGRSSYRFDARRGVLLERKVQLFYGEPEHGAEYEVELRASDADPFAEKR